jgi:hypothetical protein
MVSIFLGVLIALSDIISKKGVMDCLLLLFHSSSSDAMLQVVGDKKGTVFGGLVEAPLQPSSSKKYQVSPQHFDILFVKKILVLNILQINLAGDQ